MDVFRMIWNQVQGSHSEGKEVGLWLSNHVDLIGHVSLRSSLAQMTTGRLIVLQGALEDCRANVSGVGEILTELRDICRTDATPTVTRGITAAMVSLFKLLSCIRVLIRPRMCSYRFLPPPGPAGRFGRRQEERQ